MLDLTTRLPLVAALVVTTASSTAAAGRRVVTDDERIRLGDVIRHAPVEIADLDLLHGEIRTSNGGVVDPGPLLPAWKRP